MKPYLIAVGLIALGVCLGVVAAKAAAFYLTCKATGVL